MKAIHDNDPREQHYIFAHRALLTLAQENPSLLLDKARSGELNTFLYERWNQVGAAIPQHLKVVPTGLSSQYLIPSHRHQVIVVTLPAANRNTEAICVAIVFEEEKYRSRPFVKRKPAVSVFILEYNTTHSDNSHSTVVSQWKNGAHRTLGYGPSNVENFVASITAHLIGGQIQSIAS